MLAATFMQSVGEALAPTISTLIVALLGAAVMALPKAFAWLNDHAKIANHAAADAVVQRVLGVVETAVSAASQQAIDSLKKSAFATNEDRKAAFAAAKNAVVQSILSDLSAQSLLADAKQVMGAAGPNDMTDRIGQMVEASVARSKSV